MMYPQLIPEQSHKLNGNSTTCTTHRLTENAEDDRFPRSPRTILQSWLSGFMFCAAMCQQYPPKRLLKFLCVFAAGQLWITANWIFVVHWNPADPTSSSWTIWPRKKPCCSAERSCCCPLCQPHPGLTWVYFTRARVLNPLPLPKEGKCVCSDRVWSMKRGPDAKSCRGLLFCSCGKSKWERRDDHWNVHEGVDPANASPSCERAKELSLIEILDGHSSYSRMRVPLPVHNFRSVRKSLFQFREHWRFPSSVSLNKILMKLHQVYKIIKGQPKVMSGSSPPEFVRLIRGHDARYCSDPPPFRCTSTHVYHGSCQLPNDFMTRGKHRG